MMEASADMTSPLKQSNFPMGKQCKLTPFNNNKVMRVRPIDEENPEPFEQRLGRADTHQKDTSKKNTAEVNDSDS
jgi:hypothetical protein